MMTKKKKKIPLSESTGDSSEEVDIFASVMFSDQAFSRLRKKREVVDALYLCIAKKKAMKGVELTHDFENVRLRRWFGQKMSSIVVAVFTARVGGHFEQTFDWRFE